MRRMKELWHYLLGLFEENDRLRKRIARTRDVGQFEDAVAAVFRELPMKEEMRYAQGKDASKGS